MQSLFVLIKVTVTYSEKFWQGKMSGKFGETNIISQYFTQPNFISSIEGLFKL